MLPKLLEKTLCRNSNAECLFWQTARRLCFLFSVDLRINFVDFCRFLELQFPQRSKVLRTGAFVVPFIFDTAPLFCRVSVALSRSSVSRLRHSSFFPQPEFERPTLNVRICRNCGKFLSCVFVLLCKRPERISARLGRPEQDSGSVTHKVAFFAKIIEMNVSNQSIKTFP